MAAVFLQKDNAWREFLNPLRGLSMDRIMQLVEQGERGACADLQWFYQAMERSDALIATVVMRRRAALLSSQWDVLPEREPTDPVLAREQAAFLRDEYDKVGNLRECVAFLSTATFRGYAHAEKHYDGKGGLLTMLTEAGSGTLAGSAHSEAFRQVAQADAVLVAEALRRDFDAPLLAAAFPGWPIEAGLEIEVAGAGEN
jgi:phage gp29-like protein